MSYYFYCMCYAVDLGVKLIYLGRENSKLSTEIGFTKFGSVYDLIWIFEFSYCIETRLKE